MFICRISVTVTFSQTMQQNDLPTTPEDDDGLTDQIDDIVQLPVREGLVHRRPTQLDDKLVVPPPPAATGNAVNSITGCMLYVAITLLFGMLCLNINCR